MIDRIKLAALLAAGKPVRDIAKTFHVSRQRIHQIANKLGFKKPVVRQGGKVLYRHFDANGVLLYIGIATCAAARLKSHRRAPWYDSITRIEITRFSSYQATLIAERNAIRNENPLYNKIHNGQHIGGKISMEKLHTYLLETMRPNETAYDRYERFGEQLGMSMYGVRKWVYGARRVPDHMKVQIQRITNGRVTIEDLVRS